jgi:predicted N-acetyltransferase YhbS
MDILIRQKKQADYPQVFDMVESAFRTTGVMKLLPEFGIA